MMRQAASGQEVAAAAEAFLGTPWHLQGSLVGAGCDCIGLIRGVWRALHGAEPEAPVYAQDWAETGSADLLLAGLRRWLIAQPPEARPVGAVLAFRMRGHGAVRHCGVLTGAGRFVHATERRGVAASVLDARWQRRVAAVFLFPAEI